MNHVLGWGLTLHLLRNISGLEANTVVEKEDTYEGIAYPRGLMHNISFRQKQAVTDESQTTYMYLNV